MEPIRSAHSESLLPSTPQWIHDAVQSASETFTGRSKQALGAVGDFATEHKTALAITAGGVAVIGAIAFRGKLTSVSERFLPDASKVLADSNFLHDAAKAEKLAQKAASPDWRQRYEAACSWDSSPRLLASMSQDESLQVRMMVAKHPMTPKATLHTMRATDVKEVSEAAQFGLERRANMQIVFARDPRASADTLHRLAIEPSQTTKIREAVGLHRDTGARTLDFLARDPSPHVRTVVAGHWGTPERSLSALARDENLYVRESAAANPNMPDAMLPVLAKDKFPGPRFEVASHPATSASLLEALSRDRNYVVRSGVGANRNTPATALERLSQDGREEVREVVARNPNTDTATLQKLKEDESGLVRISAKKALRARTL